MNDESDEKLSSTYTLSPDPDTLPVSVTIPRLEYTVEELNRLTMAELQERRKELEKVQSILFRYKAFAEIELQKVSDALMRKWGEEEKEKEKYKALYNAALAVLKSNELQIVVSHPSCLQRWE